MNPLCFVLMPFGRKTDENGRLVDFDAVYRDILAPAVTGAKLDVIRADEEQVGGSIHKPMFERLLLCEYAIGDLTGANPNVYYELGVRHALRPKSTLIVFAEGTKLPFDVAPLRGLPYQLDEEGRPANADKAIEMIRGRFVAVRKEGADDSPVYQLVEGMPRFEVDHEKTDVFRERVKYSNEFKSRLKEARRQGAEAVRAVAADPRLEDASDVESGILVDLFLSYRDVQDHQAMLDLYDRLPVPLQRARMVQEQRAFALNRLKQADAAEAVLKQVIADHGPSSETNGLLGRVYKDRWSAALAAGSRLRAGGELRRAVEAYLAGFEADWRDPYPGINAVTLMEMQDPVDPRQAEILPVVRYAAQRRARRPSADYWDFATILELAVLARDEAAAVEALENAVTRARAGWELTSTARNLALIRTKREERGENAAWIGEVVAELEAGAAQGAKAF